jgi:hypothetical protein
MVVLAMAFQATLQLDGFQPDQACLDLVSQLLKVIQPMLASTTYPVPGQHLIWRGFAPLVQKQKKEQVIWPILLQPDASSGIRPDLLSLSRYAVPHTQGEEESKSSAHSELQTTIWRMPGVRFWQSVSADICRHRISCEISSRCAADWSKSTTRRRSSSAQVAVRLQ